MVPPLSSAIVCPPTHLRCAAVVCSRCRCHLRSATAAPAAAFATAARTPMRGGGEIDLKRGTRRVAEGDDSD